MSKLSKALIAAAGNSGGAGLTVEDVFSTYLYDGTGATQSINNGIDLDGEGGMTWIKCRNTAFNNVIFDTERGAPNALLTNTTDQNISFYSDSLTSFNSDGFSLGADTTSLLVNNGSNRDYCSWSFRKAEKFFDVVTYTGDGNAATQISHSLNSTPGVIIVKKTSAAGNWSVYHSYLGTGNYLRLEKYFGDTTDADYFPEVTDSYFRPGSDNHINESGQSFVAYLFASDAGGFGDDGDENIIKCGSYTGTGGFLDVNVGFEPQFVIVKSADFGNSDTDWFIIDTMRGFTFNPNTNYEFQALRANENTAEAAQGRCGLTSTGFLVGGIDATGASGRNYIYIAIRRPMKTPESGTEVFNPTTAAVGTDITNNFPADLWFGNNTSGDGGNNAHTFASRLTGLKWLQTATAAAESTASNTFYWDSNTTFTNSQFGGDRVGYYLKRATGFFDVVAYSGNATVRTVPHNLGVVPELMIVKKRNTVKNWYVYSAADSTKYLYLNGTNAFVSGSAEQIFGNDSTTVAPTSSVFSLGSQAAINGSGDTFITYLFATLAGVSKVGSYTGTGSNVDVDCGFSAGARFILIKRTDSTGDWYVWDSERGIVAGNDPYLLLNSTAAEVTSTDYIDPLASGFTVTASAPAALNASGGSYIFLAIS